MDSVAKDITQIRVPPSDEAIPKALADLSANLSAWKAAFLEIQTELLHQAEAQRDLQVKLEQQAMEHAQLQSALESQATAQTAMQRELKAQAEVEARVQQDLLARQEAEAAAAASSRSQQQPESSMRTAQPGGQEASNGSQPSVPLSWNSETISKHVRVYGEFAKQPAEAEPKAVPAEDNDDEALLATLDPETAKAIRVMRRMSSNKKSVRELLEQYQTAQATAKAEPGKKSWFRRGK